MNFMNLNFMKLKVHMLKLSRRNIENKILKIINVLPGHSSSVYTYARLRIADAFISVDG